MATDGELDATAVNAVLAAAGDRGAPVRRRWPADLTDREIDVLRRIAVGGSIQEAAADLHVAPKTVDFHLQNIYSKVGVTSRAQPALPLTRSRCAESAHQSSHVTRRTHHIPFYLVIKPRKEGAHE